MLQRRAESGERRAESGEPIISLPRISINHRLNLVRVWEGGKNATQTYFSAKQYGSLENAFEMAIQYEHQLPEQQRIGHIKPLTKPTVRNTSGIVGVCPFCNKSGYQAGWRSHWTQEVDGKRHPKTKDFSFFTFGNRAFHLACEYRKAMVDVHMKVG